LLERGNEVDKKLMLWLIDAFFEINAGGFSDEIRRTFYDPIVQEIRSLGDGSNGMLMRALRSKDLHWEHVLDKAMRLYESLREGGHWKWVASKDKKASPQFYLNEPKTETNSTLKCWGCNTPGVKKADCPKCKNKSSDTSKNNKKNRNNRKKNGIDHPAPKDGEQQMKVVENRLYWWCPKCNRWVSMHLPKDHGKNAKVTTEQLIEMKKDFLNSGKVPPSFNFCEIVSDEGINL
jgi:hypothetical protein